MLLNVLMYEPRSQDNYLYTLELDRAAWRNILKLQEWLRKIRRQPMPDGLFVSVEIKVYDSYAFDDTLIETLEDEWLVGDNIASGQPIKEYYARLNIYRASFDLEGNDLCSCTELSRKRLLDLIKVYLPPKGSERARSEARTRKLADIEPVDEDNEEDDE